MSVNHKIFHQNITPLYLTKDQCNQAYNRFSSQRSMSSNESNPSAQSSRASDGSNACVSKLSNFWKNAIIIVMMPFVITGAPILTILFTAGQVEKGTFTMVKWIKFILSGGNFLILNLISLLITLALNGWLLYLFFDILIALFVYGQISGGFAQNLFEFFETLPVVLLVDFFWIKGFRLRQIIQITNSTLWQSGNISYAPNIIKLSLALVLCVLLHIINYFTFKFKLDQKLTIETLTEYFGHLPHRLINSFLFPVYMAFCGAVQSRNRRMNEYIRSLMVKPHRPDMVNLKDIKNQFKTNGQLIRHINSMFNIVMSVFIIVLFLQMLRECIYSSYNTAAIIIDEFLATNFSKKIFEADLSNSLIRCMAADVVVILMKLGLIGLIIMQMMAVNHESRAAPIMLNDLVSQFDHIIHRDLFQSFRILRYYMKSRLDQTNRANLVYVSIFSFVPALKSVLLIQF